MTETTLAASHGAQEKSDPSTAVTNADVDWNIFDSGSYSDENYGFLRDEDHEILKHIREYFSAHAPRQAVGIDVGAGANLYPALSMLPFCDQIELCDYSSTNVRWLNEQLPSFSNQWDPFWEVLAEQPSYADVQNPRKALAVAAIATQRSVFELPERQWSMGTMFFLACSMSTEKAEFKKAVRCFVRALTPGSVFAMAFMVGSLGYIVDNKAYPAALLGVDDIYEYVQSIAYDVEVHSIKTQNPHRDGFHEMLLVTGKSGF